MTDRLLTASELGEVLGLSPATILDWFEDDRLPGFKLGRAVRFREAEVLAWLEEHRRGPSPSCKQLPRVPMIAAWLTAPAHRSHLFLYACRAPLGRGAVADLGARRQERTAVMATKPQDDLELVREALALAPDMPAQIKSLRAEIDGLDDGYNPMSEQARLDLHKKLDEKADGELVWLLLCSQKILETRTTGKLRNLAEHQTTILAAVLERFAPEALADGLAIYTEFQGDEDEDEDDA